MYNALNINIGILGHVDSGKTSLAKCLSTISSTAAFDKNPQSQERGITLDLGFSSFTVPMLEHLKNATDKDILQYTLVDCPGHASLIRTIIGGVQIIDMMLLVIDVTKGIQTQTAECIVIGEITCKKFIVVFNKVDLLEEEKREQLINKMKLKVSKVLSTTVLGNQEIPIVATSVNNDKNFIGLDELINTIGKLSFIPERKKDDLFQFAVDHCFAIKGQGTVMTGTILQGSVKLNDAIDIPTLGITKKVKSMHMFRKPVQEAHQGDRLGICVTQFDPKLLERGIVCSPGLGSFVDYAIIDANIIKYFKHSIESKAKFHITIGYATVLAQITIFKRNGDDIAFDIEGKYQFVESIELDGFDDVKYDKYFVLLHFESPIYAINNSIVIASKLDMDIHKNTCRLAFWGRLLHYSKEKDFLNNVHIYNYKQKTGIIDRIVDGYNIIVKNMFKKETDLAKFVNMNVQLDNGDIGKIESAFGQSGKVKVYISQGINSNDLQSLKNSNVILTFKKYLFTGSNKLSQ